jgi:hypothetical protein
MIFIFLQILRNKFKAAPFGFHSKSGGIINLYYDCAAALPFTSLSAVLISEREA